jgi:hypothetical protein
MLRGLQMLSLADAVQKRAKNQVNCNKMEINYGGLVPILRNNSYFSQ